MKNETQNTYWRSLAERRESSGTEASEGTGGADSHGGDPTSFSRRRFLEAAGFTASLVALNGCGRAPIKTALPFPKQPEGVTPGRTRSFASTCAGCRAACGMLVRVRDGRPLKMEGMPEHPLSRGGLCSIGQALPMGLYDSHRLKQPLRHGKDSTWAEVDEAIIAQLTKIKQDGGAVRFVTTTNSSPTLQATIGSFLSDFRDAAHVVFDPVSSSAILDAHDQTHGTRVLPHYQFDKAKVIVAFGADFLGTWISPVEFTAAWSSGRTPTAEQPAMSFHVQFEGRMTLTGSNADKRYRVTPEEYGVILSKLAVTLSQLAGQDAPDGQVDASPIPDAELDQLATRLWESRGASLVVSDSQDVAVQRLVNFINHTLGNYGRTLDVARPSQQRSGDDTAVLRLVEEIESGGVSALIVAGVDLTHDLPQRETLVEGLAKVPLVVSLAERQDDFASLAHFVCPDHHPLESWADAEPVRGLFSLTQPMLEPLMGTRSILESLTRWSGRRDDAYSLVRAHWEANVFPLADQPTFQSFWDHAVHDGLAEFEIEPLAHEEFKGDVVHLMSRPIVGENYCVTLYSKVGMTESRHAHNPWLQELPDPVTKVTWDNYVSVSPATARKLGVRDGDVVRVKSTGGQQIELPAFVQPGQHDRVLAIALGYGVQGTDRFANIGPKWLQSRPTVAKGELVGKNAAAFVVAQDGALSYSRSDVTIAKTGRRRDLASTQAYHSLEMPRSIAPHGAEVRDIIQETTLAAFQEDPTSGTPVLHHIELPSHDDAAARDDPTELGEATTPDKAVPQDMSRLWPEDHEKAGHWWGMSVDLNKCTGCSACLIACQSENNVPVVGKDEVRRQREMHWIRIDRYYSGPEDDVEVAHQPMMCQHCDNAPCETVCPVLATVHGEEGLNQQAYNRCVGTRYCANNCPYKVRRFNWFRYAHDDSLQNLALNPDVTVRTRGVMEKCSMCVQRINDGKLEAKRLGQPLEDGTIQTACQQSCPAQAIVFGDMNDPDSQLHQALEDPRRFRVLEEFNFRPSIAYLRVVRNRETEKSEDGKHV